MSTKIIRSPARQQGDVWRQELVPSLTVGAWIRLASLITRIEFLELVLSKTSYQLSVNSSGNFVIRGDAIESSTGPT